MIHFSKRLKVLGFGAAIVAGEIFAGSSAKAFFYITSATDVNQCNTIKGKVTYYSEPKGDRLGYCDTPNDLACIEALNSNDAVYDEATHQCTTFTALNEANTASGSETSTSSDDIYIDDLDGCFLTTACVDHIGLEDDCFELRTLRAFRDTVLVKTETGLRDIAQYYMGAPKLVQQIAASPHSGRELSRAYFLYIVPSVICAKLGLNKWAHKVYRAMMHDLAQRA